MSRRLLSSPVVWQVTPPASEPLTLADAKTHLRVEHAIDDTLITGLITAAREYIEKVAWRGVMQQTWELVLDKFPEQSVPGWSAATDRGEVELPRGNLISVGSVKYVDDNGATQTLVATTDYTVDTNSPIGRVFPAFGKWWPIARAPQWDAVRIRYDVGWTTAGAVPMSIRQAMLLLLSQLWEQRAVEVVGSINSETQFAVDMLLAPYRLQRI